MSVARIPGYFFVSFAIGIGLFVGIIRSFPDQYVHVVTCDVGQGDAIVVSYRSSQVLIDGGPDSKVLDCLSRHIPFWDRTLEVMILTHPQADHMNGLVEVLDRFAVEQVIVNGVVNDTAGFRAFQDAVFTEGASIHLPSRGDVIRIEELELSILWPSSKAGLAEVWQAETGGAILGAATYQGDLNETTIVTRLSYGDFDALFVGDIGFSTEEALVADGVLGKVELLKVGHHGSKYASSAEFLNAVRPALGVISVGAQNRFGHPTQETLMRLDQVGARILRTDVSGDVEVDTDGNKYWVVN